MKQLWTIATVAAFACITNIGGLETASPSISPSFDFVRSETYSFQMGATALLPCVIRNLNNESVSWIRSSDSRILTVGEEVFISDPRISTIVEEKHNLSSCTLQIKSVSPSDEGRFECQVSTEPKLSHFIHLIVKVPRVSIFGDRDVFVKSWSSVHLKCVISGTGSDGLGAASGLGMASAGPSYIEWRRDGVRLTAPSGASFGTFGPAGRVRITPPEHIAEATTISTLSITHAVKSDAGQYTCQPALLDSANVTLHVLESDYPAAMQTGDVGHAPAPSNLFAAALSLSVIAACNAQLIE